MHFPRACLPKVLSDCIRVQYTGRGFSFLACLNFRRLLSSFSGTFRLCPPGRSTESKSFSSVKRIRSTVFCTSLPGPRARVLCVRSLNLAGSSRSPLGDAGDEQTDLIRPNFYLPGSYLMSSIINDEFCLSPGTSVSHLLCATKKELQNVVLGRRYANNEATCHGELRYESTGFPST